MIEFQIFALLVMRTMIRHQAVDGTVGQALAQGFAVGGGAKRRIYFQIGVKIQQRTVVIH